MPHRFFEHVQARTLLEVIFPDRERFAVHPALPGGTFFADEGAANLVRIAARHDSPGVELLTYNYRALAPDPNRPKIHAGRQSLEASAALARRHLLDPTRTVVVQQNPDVIDGGGVHNDIVCLGNRDVLIFHEKAFLDPKGTLDELMAKGAASGLRAIEVPDAMLSLEEAISAYLFNSMLVDSPDGGMLLLAPTTVQDSEPARACVDWLIDRGAIERAEWVDVSESLGNGGGPGCLRVRVALSGDEIEKIHAPVLLDEPMIQRLEAWVDRHYRDALGRDDLRDPALMEESFAALDELTQILRVGSVYPFQQA